MPRTILAARKRLGTERRRAGWVTTAVRVVEKWPCRARAAVRARGRARVGFVVVVVVVAAAALALALDSAPDAATAAALALAATALALAAAAISISYAGTRNSFSRDSLWEIPARWRRPEMGWVGPPGWLG